MRSFALSIARRYLFSRKSHSAINIISLISVAGVAVGTMGLIVVLSVFNGFGNLVMSLYNSFDPDMRITVVEGKTFDPDTPAFHELLSSSDIKASSGVLEETVLLSYNDRQQIASIKGIDQRFLQSTGLDTMVVDGSLLLESKGESFAVPGYAIAYTLGLSTARPFNALTIYAPKPGVVSSLNPEQAFNQRSIEVSGVFAIQQDFDSKYVLVPLGFAREILNEENEISSLEILLKPGVDHEEFMEVAQAKLGAAFEVKDRLRQHDFLYKILRSEKFAVYLILSFILLIATFSIIGSLSMLIIDKKKDIAVLWALGADISLLRKIFMIEGLLITVSGAFFGLVLGFLICYAQQTFGLISINNGGGSFIIDAYPVKMQIIDFLYVFATVSFIGMLASWFPSRSLLSDERLALADL